MAHAWILTITKDDNPVGFWWWTPVQSTNKVFECHVCIAEEYQKRWLTKSVRTALINAVEEMEADYCLAIHPEPTVARMLCRFGFLPYGQIHILDVKEIDRGRIFPTSSTNIFRPGTCQGGAEEGHESGPQS